MLWRVFYLTISVLGLASSVLFAQLLTKAPYNSIPPNTLESRFSKDFVGTIDKYSVHLHLSREGSNLYGNYFYVPQKIAMLSIFSDLFVEGKVDVNGVFNLKETVFTEHNKEIQTGKFQGSISQSAHGARLSGTWVKQDDNKLLKFELVEARARLPKGTIIKSAKMRESNRRLAGKVMAVYPQIAGGRNPGIVQCNQIIKKHVTNSMRNFRKEVLGQDAYDESLEHVALDISYEINFINEELISITFLEETDYGGAHPNHYKSFVNCNLKEGKEIKLAQLFRPDIKYKTVIKNLLESNLKEISTDNEGDSLSKWYFDRASCKSICSKLNISANPLKNRASSAFP
jgi:hypothetical protein